MMAVSNFSVTDSFLPGTLHTASLRPVNKNGAFGIGVVEIVLFRLGAQSSNSLWLGEVVAAACQCPTGLEDGSARR